MLKVNKTYPKFAEFLAEFLEADLTTITNTVRLAREAGCLRHTRRGRGSVNVTPIGAANVFLALVGAGLHPENATRTLIWLRSLKAENPGDARGIEGLPEDWAGHYADDALAAVIKARMDDENFGPLMTVRVNRYAQSYVDFIFFNPGGSYQAAVFFRNPSPRWKAKSGFGHPAAMFGISEAATLQPHVWRAVGDWLADRITKTLRP